VRFFSIALLVLLTSVAAFSQSRPILQPKAEMRIEDADDRIITEKFLPNENKLLLVSQKQIRVWDLVTEKLVASRPIDVPEITEDKPRVISPNGQYMIVFGNYDARDKRNQIKQPASIWNLETGKQIAVFDKTTRPVRYAAWSRNGRTLVTASETIDQERIVADPIEISFWDGESFQFLNTAPADNIKWSYLSADGSTFFYSVARVKRLLLIDKYLSDSEGPISVWDIRSGKVEQTIFANPNDQAQEMRSISVSPDERFLTYVTQPPKSKDVERTLVVSNIDRTNSGYAIHRKYEIKPTPKISDWSASFSPDGKFLTLITGKVSYWSTAGGLVLQLYATEAGSKTAELTKHYAPGYWLNDNQILLFDYGNSLEAVEVPSGRKLYETKLVYKFTQLTVKHTRRSTAFPGMTETYSDYTGGFRVLEETKILPHASGKMFLTYSNQYVKVYDAQTGDVLQTLVEPAVDTSKPVDPKKGPRLSGAPLVSKAEWSSDGNTLYIVSADKKSVSFWSMN